MPQLPFIVTANDLDGIKFQVNELLRFLAEEMVSKDGTLAGNSDEKVPTVKAVKTLASTYILKSILTAAGDIIYSTASATPGNLAVIANKRLFGNAAGTAPEYVTGIKLGTFTRDMATASGNQAVTGVGFLPSYVIFLAALNNSARMSIGFDDGTNAYSVGYDSSWQVQTTASIVLWITSPTDGYAGKITSLDSDGFTIVWSRLSTPTGTAQIFYLAFR